MVEQIARQLAEELVKSEYGQAFIAAKQAYDKDLDAQNMLKEYRFPEQTCSGNYN